MREAIGRTPEPFVDGGLAAVDGDVGEFLDKHAEQLVDIVFANACGKPVEGGLRDLGVAVATILGDE
jgi:hypothetical protein